MSTFQETREAARKFMDECLVLHMLDEFYRSGKKRGVLFSAPSGLSFRMQLDTINDNGLPRYDVRLYLADPKHGGGVEHATKSPEFAYAYDSGIVAGVNHGYLHVYCSRCSRRDCPVDDSCIGVQASGGEVHKRTLIDSADPVIHAMVSTEQLEEVFGKVLKRAFDMKLCSCKQWFAGICMTLCTSCLAASAVGAAAACIVCHEPAAKRTRCCKQAMHKACHVTHTEHAPPGREATCPTCRAGSYKLD
jgi:hypothetical protein